MRAHTQAEKHLTRLELRKMIAHSYALEAFADVFYQTGFLECIHAECEIHRKVRSISLYLVS